VQRKNDGSTAFNWASMNGRMLYLIDRGADTDAKNSNEPAPFGM
jgi:hypothetical protein